MATAQLGVRKNMPQVSQINLLPSAARTATATPVEFTVGPGVHALSVYAITSAAGVTPSTVFSIEGYDETTDTWVLLLASAAVTAAGTAKLLVGPDVVTAANAAAATPFFPLMRVTAVHGNATSHTYSVSAVAS